MAKLKNQSKRPGRNDRYDRYGRGAPALHTREELEMVVPPVRGALKPWQPKSEAQAQYLSLIRSKDIVFCKGPMGTGKTYVAVAEAADELKAGRTEKLVITRPAIEAEEELGILPGDLHEKWAPYFAPVRRILEERLGAGYVEYCIKVGKIEIAPIGHLRGHTFNDCWVIFDEAQNCTKGQMKLVLTRFGQNCKMIVDGDPDEQLDIPGSVSGYDDAWVRMDNHPDIGHMEFDVDDIVRSGLCRDILLRYRKEIPVGQPAIQRLCSA